MNLRRNSTGLVLLLAPLSLSSGCAVRAGSPAAAIALMPSDRPAAALPPPLERSLFARDPGGQLTEDSLQKILDAPIEMALPGRVGILPISTAVDWRGPGPSYRVPTGSSALARALRGSEPFTLVTEMMSIPSGALGMEALREIAARYRLRYVLLYREEFGRRSRSNGWAAGYATVLGAFLLPGQTLTSYGFVEATLMDVKTGTLLYTVRRSSVREVSANVWHNDDKLDGMEAQLALDLAPALAADARAATAHYAEAVRVERTRRLAAVEPPVAAARIAE